MPHVFHKMLKTCCMLSANIIFSVFFFSLIFLSSSSVLSDLIIDSTSSITQDQYQCLYNQGDNFTIARVYDPSGQIDQVGIQNLQQLDALKSSDFTDIIMVDAIFSPCLANCKNKITNGAEQVYTVAEEMFQDYYTDQNLDYAYFFWVDIDPTQPWSSDKTANQKFLMEVVNALYQRNGGLGIRANYNAWSKLFGASFTEPSKYAKFLWWVNLNGKQDLTTGWTPFGGWTKPYAHQYAVDVTAHQCVIGIPVNLSFYDSSSNTIARFGQVSNMQKRINPKFSHKKI